MQIQPTKWAANYADQLLVDVQFVVLHYTGLSLQQSLDWFYHPKTQVSAHFLVNTDGQIFELVPCFNQPAKMAYHAGNSHWATSTQNWFNFNQISLGIELVNYNGNLFNYPKPQFLALLQLLHQLKQQYPNLNNPNRVLGHEQIAGFRGKMDPGFNFNWVDLFEQLFDQQPDQPRLPSCPPSLLFKLAQRWQKKPELGFEQWLWFNINAEACLKALRQQSCVGLSLDLPTESL